MDHVDREVIEREEQREIYRSLGIYRPGNQLTLEEAAKKARELAEARELWMQKPELGEGQGIFKRSS